MSSGHEVPFRKMHGAGNDFVFVDLDAAREQGVPVDLLRAEAAAFARHVCARHFGIGADGLMLLDLAQRERSDVRLWMYNSDGSRAATCGNALRCVARILFEQPGAGTEFEILTDAGPARACVETGPRGFAGAELAMGTPIFEVARIPFEAARDPGLRVRPGRPLAFDVEIGGQDFAGYVLSMGNPHAVLFVERDPEDFDLERIGRTLQASPSFADSVNVELVHAAGPQDYVQRTWERGAGETLACGSGACAVAVAAISSGRARADAPLQLRLRGGELRIRWDGAGPVRMFGPAEHVCHGVCLWNPLDPS